MVGHTATFTFKVGPLNTHTCSISPTIIGFTGGRLLLDSFGIFRCSAVAFNLTSPMVAKYAHLRPIFRAGNSQQSLGARSGEHGGWVMTVIAAQQAMCGSVRYRDAETTATCHAASSELHRPTSARLAPRNDQQHSAQAVRTYGASGIRCQRILGIF
jgi:hypothetical protein